jgi:hypothetical protein
MDSVDPAYRVDQSLDAADVAGLRGDGDRVYRSSE